MIPFFGGRKDGISHSPVAKIDTPVSAARNSFTEPMREQLEGSKVGGGSEQTSTTTPISTCPQCEATNGKPKCVQIFGLNNWIDEQYKLYIKANESHIPIGTEKRACTFGFALWLKNSLSQPSQNGRPLRKNPEGVATCGDAGELVRGCASFTPAVKDAPQKGKFSIPRWEFIESNVAGASPEHVPCELGCYTHPKVQCGCQCHKKDVGGAFVVDDAVVKRMVSGYCNTLYSLGKGEGASPKCACGKVLLEDDGDVCSTCWTNNYGGGSL